MAIGRRRLFIALLAALLVLAACLLLASLAGLRSFIREAILLPLAGLFWLGGVFLRSANEAYLWLAGLVIFFVLLVNGLAQALRGAGGARGEASRMSEAEEKLAAGRVRFWLSRVNMFSAWGAASDYARADLRRLAKKIDELLGSESRAEVEIKRLLDDDRQKQKPSIWRRKSPETARRAAQIEELCSTLEKLAQPGGDNPAAAASQKQENPQES